MQRALKKIGNSAGMIIPKPFLSQLGVQVGDTMEMRIEGGKLVVERVKPHPRAGWAEAAAAIAAAGDDKLVWEEFGNDGDDELTW